MGIDYEDNEYSNSKISNHPSVRAYVTITLDDELLIHDIRIIETGGKLILSMPNRRNKNGEFIDSVHPITSEFRNKLTDAVLEKYNAS